MELKGTQNLALPRQQVWDSLNDPEVLKACIPGCEEVARVNEDEFRLAMTASVGPVKARFKGKLLISERVPPVSYVLTFEGSGGPAGFGKGHAQVALESAGSDTVLTYKASAQVGGKLAQVGSRLVEGVAQKMAGAFFERFRQVVSPQAPVELPLQRSVQTAPVADKARDGVWPSTIIFGLAAVAALLLICFRVFAH
jgi:carbon monoxide dehydrogenase subunit G